MDNPIIVALDGMDEVAALDMARRLQGYVWGFKVNDLFFKMGIDVLKLLGPWGKIMLDGKFHDIPNTVANTLNQLQSAERPDIITVHASGGREMISAAVHRFPSEIAAVTVLTSIDSERCNHVYNSDTSAAVTRLAAEAKAGGASYVVCSAKELKLSIFQENYEWACKAPKIVPGIRPKWFQDEGDDQKRTATPAEAMADGAAFLVMGRPILRADDPCKAAEDTLEEIRKG